MKSFKPLTIIFIASLLFTTSNIIAKTHTPKIEAVNTTKDKALHQPKQKISLTDKKSVKKIIAPTNHNPQIEAELVNSVNINTASVEELSESLTGVGRKKAEAIVEYRKAHGKFTKPEQLMEVKGIGESIFEKNKDHIEL